MAFDMHHAEIWTEKFHASKVIIQRKKAILGLKMEEDRIFNAVFLTIHLLFWKKNEKFYVKPIHQKISWEK